MDTREVDRRSDSGSSFDEARHLAGVAMERAAREVDERMGSLSESLSHFAEKLEHSFGDSDSGIERRVVNETARFARRISTGIEGKSAEQLLSQAQRGVQERPVLMAAGFALLGFIGGRLLRGASEKRS